MRLQRIAFAAALAACIAAVAAHPTLVAGTSATRQAAGQPIPSSAAHLVTHSVESGGIERSYAVYLPDHREAGARGVVLDLHGSGSHPAQELIVSGLAAVAEERGLAVLLPVAVVPFPAGGHTWNVPREPGRPDDVGYLIDLLDDAALRYGLDTDRVWVTGFSGGARLASAFADRHPERVAALAAVGGLRAPAGDGEPVPVLAVHGTEDPINPYPGGGKAYWGYGVDRALAGWVARNRCSDRTGEGSVAPSVQRWIWRDCAGDSEVTLYRFDGGHVWPGSALPLPVERFGPAPRGFDATAAILDFFERHGLRSARVGSRPTRGGLTLARIARGRHPSRRTTPPAPG